MLQNFKKYILLVLTAFLLIAAVFVFHLDWQSSHRKLTFAMLDVGQGDALFIESPTGTQVLIDAGPPRKILSQLLHVMPAFDRSIDAIIITHPDQDHIGGFSDVLKTYKVGKVFDPGILDDSKTHQNLEDEIKNQNIPNILARRGMHLDLGGGAVIDILFPDQDVSSWETNEGSVVAKLSYGKISVMLTGDAPQSTERIILSENFPAQLHSDILKVGHHGSRNSSSLEFLQAVSPEYALISDGKDNKYGHPHKEVLDILNQIGAKIFRTDQDGTMVMKCDKINGCMINK